ncbi:MAG: hypothetical protein NTZ24_10290 [Deltaproteobacteria bacterium]|nr:hypothetical protein [Deltaproteobacteria bacterium]
MVVNLSAVRWGPQFIVPTIAIKKYYGCVVLRENYNDELLKKDLEDLSISGYPIGVSNAWFIRKKGTQTWVKVGESSNRQLDYAVRFDSAEFKNGTYQILGFMNVKVKTEDREITISRQNIADLEIKN